LIVGFFMDTMDTMDEMDGMRQLQKSNGHFSNDFFVGSRTRGREKSILERSKFTRLIKSTDSILVFLLREAFGVRRSSFALFSTVMNGL